MSEGRPSAPSISDYALLSDCHSVALVSGLGSIDWFCSPRIDSPSVFGRLLDPDHGGSCRLGPATSTGESSVERRYLDRTMVLETVHRTDQGELRVLDCLAMHRGGRSRPFRQLIRIAECTSGTVDVAADIAIRFDFGMIPPWLRAHDDRNVTAVGGSSGLAVWCSEQLDIVDRHDLRAGTTLHEGESMTLSFTSHPPARLDDGPPESTTADDLRSRLDETVRWWRNWCDRRAGGHDGLGPHALRSAIVLKSLVHAPTGAIAAAATTSLPEIPGGSWNWDYRFSWVRDSWLTVRSLAEAGFGQEAQGFHRFIERSSAGSGRELQLMYGVDGRHRIPEVELDDVAGYRDARPVRVGNAAHGQLQLDMYGYMLELTSQRVGQGLELDESFWRFVVELVDIVCGSWKQPDHGIWELRGDAQHYVYSKVQCWVALDRGLDLARRLDRIDDVDAERWSRSRDAVRTAIESKGMDANGGFTATFDGDDVDACLLLIPECGFVAPDDACVAATVDRVIEELDDSGLIRRFRHADDSATEGAFVACTFWLVERLVGLGRIEEARRYYQHALDTANDVGLFAEEYDSTSGEMLGNFPQAMSHLAQIGAAHELARFDRRRSG